LIVVVAIELGEGPAVREVERIERDSGRCWPKALQVCFAAQVATTVPTDIDIENYQVWTGPP